MVPAACLLLWALLLSLGLRAAGAQDQTSTPPAAPTGMQRVTFRFGGPARSHRSTSITARNTFPRKGRITLEDENDVLVTTDRLAGPAAAELLATLSGLGRSSVVSPIEEEGGSLEEGVVIDARKSTSFGPPSTTPNALGVPSTTPNALGVPSTTAKFWANSEEGEIKLTTSLTPFTSKSTFGDLSSESTLRQWTTPGSTPTQWPSPSPSAMPASEDLRVVLMPWGPWHCHCKSGTMSRSRAGKLHGLSGRFRVGALSELRTEHRPCTYQQCPCDKDREECPMDSSICPDDSCSTHAHVFTTSPLPHVHLRRRPILPAPSPSPALAFWKRVRIGLEDIWNGLSSVFTEMQPMEKSQR